MILGHVLSHFIKYVLEIVKCFLVIICCDSNYDIGIVTKLSLDRLWIGPLDPTCAARDPTQPWWIERINSSLSVLTNRQMMPLWWHRAAVKVMLPMMRQSSQNTSRKTSFLLLKLWPSTEYNFPQSSDLFCTPTRSQYLLTVMKVLALNANIVSVSYAFCKDLNTKDALFVFILL